MVQKSRGPRRKTRKKMRLEKKATVNQILQTFEIGDKVHVDLQPNVKNKGYPYISYNGLTGEVIEKRGNAYMVRIRDKNALKKLILKPVHLKLQKA